MMPRRLRMRAESAEMRNLGGDDAVRYGLSNQQKVNTKRVKRNKPSPKHDIYGNMPNYPGKDN